MANMDTKTALHEHGFRATSAKQVALELLRKTGRPLSVLELLALWKGKKPDQATLYRMLHDFSATDLVRRVDLNGGVARFEYTPDSPHHHHIVCTSCGEIEDIDRCAVRTDERAVTRASSKFANVEYHTLEFFGICNDCAK